MHFDRARKVADAVLYEGYVLYPYRASSRKNQLRWQFGVLAPQTWNEAGGCEAWWTQTECVIEARPDLRFVGKARFLQLEQRVIEQALNARGDAFERIESLDAGGKLWTSWDEGVEREIDFGLPTGRFRKQVVAFELPEEERAEQIFDHRGEIAGRCIRYRASISGVVRLDAEQVASGLVKVSVRIENVSKSCPKRAAREEAMQHSMIGTHLLLGVSGGAFVSPLDPPEVAVEAIAACKNVRAWPVLAGEEGARDVILSAPIILYDYPQIAPESAGDLFDATEIDEILTLRTMTLTDEEKREARAADPRTAKLMDRVDGTSAETLERLHGGMRAEGPEHVRIDGVIVKKGCRVRLSPGMGARRTDAQDIFYAGRIGTVQEVRRDVDGNEYLAVSVEDDPARFLHGIRGRYLYFSPDEVELLEETV
ncbi:MAG: hypothetical protein ABIP39_08300 [Polyangiaceae bacterium]